MTESDQYYVNRCLDGCPDDFRHLVQRYQAVLLAYLTGKLGNRSGAEEAAQETFVRAYFGLSELKKRQSFYCWLLGIANRVTKEQLRNVKRFDDVDCLTQQQVCGESKENDLQLENAIAELPDSYREIILLRFYANQSCAQIAEQLDMPLGTVTKTLSRAYERLRQLLSNAKEVQR